MRLVQYRDAAGARKVGLVTEDGNHLRPLQGVATVYELAEMAAGRGGGLARLAESKAGSERVDYPALLKEGRVLAPVDHAEPARFWITGTGLTHIGSAAARNKMHEVTHGSAAPLSDSMKIFRIGIEGGKPGEGEIGVQPEWFYKGDGSCVVAPGGSLTRPGYAKSGGEEPEIVGLY
ncbi:MAG TPA: FAH family protein, partial [Dongiaceae bacterium]